jgi:hypothetical protein
MYYYFIMSVLLEYLEPNYFEIKLVNVDNYYILYYGFINNNELYINPIYESYIYNHAYNYFEKIKKNNLLVRELEYEDFISWLNQDSSFPESSSES